MLWCGSMRCKCHVALNKLVSIDADTDLNSLMYRPFTNHTPSTPRYHSRLESSSFANARACILHIIQPRIRNIHPIHHSRYDVVHSVWSMTVFLYTSLHPCTAVMACRTFALRSRASMMSQRANIRRRLVHDSTKDSTFHSLIIIMSADTADNGKCSPPHSKYGWNFEKEFYCVIDIKHARIKSI